MPLHRQPGMDTADLEQAIAHVERTKGRVVQVIGNINAAWWVLYDAPARKPAAPRETRAAKQ
jgi:hypothetical protein